MEIQIKRAYQPASPDDGFRAYIDRLWPRGLSHETFHYDLWEKDIAPSAELREWFHANIEARWAEFESRYKKELQGNSSFAAFCEAIKDKSKVTLLYSSHDEIHNNAIVVMDLLKGK